MAAIATGVNNGDLTAEEAGQLVNVLNTYTKVVEMHDVRARLEALESQRKRP